MHNHNAAQKGTAIKMCLFDFEQRFKEERKTSQQLINNNVYRHVIQFSLNENTFLWDRQ